MSEFYWSNLSTTQQIYHPSVAINIIFSYLALTCIQHLSLPKHFASVVNHETQELSEKIGLAQQLVHNYHLLSQCWASCWFSQYKCRHHNVRNDPGSRPAQHVTFLRDRLRRAVSVPGQVNNQRIRVSEGEGGGEYSSFKENLILSYIGYAWHSIAVLLLLYETQN